MTKDFKSIDNELGLFLRRNDPVGIPSRKELVALESSIMSAVSKLNFSRGVPPWFDIVPFWKMPPQEILRGLGTIILVMALGFVTGNVLPAYETTSVTQQNSGQLSVAYWHNFLAIPPATGDVYDY